jgi:hypothetical protein
MYDSLNYGKIEMENEFPHENGYSACHVGECKPGTVPIHIRRAVGGHVTVIAVSAQCEVGSIFPMKVEDIVPI